MLKKFLVLLISFMSILALASCEDAEELLGGSSPAFDKPLYFAEFGQEVEFKVLNVDLSSCLILVSDATVLSVEGTAVKAIKAGASTLSVVLGDKVATASVVVNPKKLVAPVLRVESGVVLWNEVENASDYIVKIDNSLETVSNTSYDLTKRAAGRYSISVAAKSHDANYSVSDFTVASIDISNSKFVGIAMSIAPTKTVYNEGDPVNLAGVKIVALYDNGSTKDISGLVECDKTKICYGDTQIVVSYEGYEVAIDITVNPRKLVAPEVRAIGEKAVWNSVENSNGYIVKINDIELEQIVFENEVDLSMYKSGAYAVAVSALPVDETYVASDFGTVLVRVNEPVLLGIEMTKAPSKTLYAIGEEVDLTGLEVIASFDKGDSVNVAALVDCDKMFVGTNDTAITISYGGFEIKIDIAVLPRLTIVNGQSVLVKEFEPNERLNLDIPTKSNKTFIAWYLDSDFTKEFDLVMPSYDTTIYARWYEGAAIVVKEGESIQAAIDSASAYDTIFVKAGAYTEYITITKPITLLGNNYGTLANKARLPETCLYPVSGENFNIESAAPIVDIRTSNVTVDGFEVNGDNPNYANIWTVERNNEIQDLLKAKFGDAFTYSAEITRDFYNSVVGKELGVDATIGIRAYGTENSDAALSNVVIKNNNIANFTYSGVQFDDYIFTKTNKDSENTGNLIDGNYFTNIVCYGLFGADDSYVGGYGMAVLTNGMASKISNNEFVLNHMGIQICSDYSNKNTSLITNNSFKNNNAGVWVNSLTSISGVNVFDNSFDMNDDYSKINGAKPWNHAIVVSSTTKTPVKINGNVIENFDAAIIVSNTVEDTILIENNYLMDNNIAVSLRPNFLTYSTPNNQASLLLGENYYVNNNQDLEVQDTNSCFVVKYVDFEGNVIRTTAKGTMPAPKISVKNNTTKLSFTTQSFSKYYEVYLNGVKVYEYVMSEGEVAATKNFDFTEDILQDRTTDIFSFRVVVYGIGDIVSNESELDVVRLEGNQIQKGSTTTTTQKIAFYNIGATPVAMSIPKNTKYEGCFSDADFTTASLVPQTLEHSTIYYELYSKSATYKIYDDAKKVVQTLTVYDGETFTLGEAPEIEGKTFVGWYNASGLTEAQRIGNDYNGIVIGGVAKNFYPKYITSSNIIISTDAELQAALSGQKKSQIWFVQSGTYTVDINITVASIQIIGFGETLPVLTGRITIGSAAANVIMSRVHVSQTYTANKREATTQSGEKIFIQTNESCRFTASGNNFTFLGGVIERTTYVTPDFGYLIYYNNPKGVLTINDSVLKAPYYMNGSAGGWAYDYAHADSTQVIGVENDLSDATNSLVMNNTTVMANGYMLFDRTVRVTLNNITFTGIDTYDGGEVGTTKYYLGYMLINSSRIESFTLTNSTIETGNIGIFLGSKADAVIVIEDNYIKAGGVATGIGVAAWGITFSGTASIKNNIYDLSVGGLGLRIGVDADMFDIDNNTFMNQTKKLDAANNAYYYVVRHDGTGTLQMKNTSFVNCREDSIAYYPSGIVNIEIELI